MAACARQKGKQVTDSPLVTTASRWVLEKYTYNSNHLIDSLKWLDRIAPGSAEALRVATVTHDMERAFPGPDQPRPTSLIDPSYNAAHAARSARIVGAWLREQDAGESLIEEVQALVRVHEDGGWPEANLLQAADSLSFLTCNVDLFLGMVRTGRWTAKEVQSKFNYSYDRIQISHLKEMALPLLEAATQRLRIESSKGQSSPILSDSHQRQRAH